MDVQDNSEDDDWWTKVPEHGYNLTSSSLPKDLQRTRCVKVYLVFLIKGGMTPEKTKRVKDRAVLRFDFDDPYDEYTGVQVSMEVDPKNTNIWLQPGKLVVKPLRYTDGFTDSESVTFPVVRGTSDKDSLGDITEALREEYLPKFSFVNAFVEGDNVPHGNRDFM